MLRGHQCGLIELSLCTIKKKKSAAVHFRATDLCFWGRMESAVKVFFKVSEATRPPPTGYITTAITEGIMCLITSFY